MRVPRAVVAAVLLISVGSSQLAAQPYPVKPVKLVVAFPAGGSNDYHARLLGQKLTELTGQPTIVENRSGVGGIIGFDAVAKAAPDGYTLLCGAGSMTVAPSLYAKLPFDVINDFAPISLIVTIQNALMIHPSIPARNVKELVALAKARPGKLNYASSGVGATPHLSMELLRSMAGVDIHHIPYKGDAPAIADLLGGQVDMYFATIAAGITHIKAGKLRALGVSSMKRAAALPEVPTLHEAGQTGYDILSWYGVLAPANTPRDIIRLLSGHLIKIIGMPDVREKFIAAGSEPATNTPEQYQALIRSDVAKFAKIVRTAGAKLD